MTLAPPTLDPSQKLPLHALYGQPVSIPPQGTNTAQPQQRGAEGGTGSSMPPITSVPPPACLMSQGTDTRALPKLTSDSELLYQLLYESCPKSFHVWSFRDLVNIWYTNQSLAQ